MLLKTFISLSCFLIKIDAFCQDISVRPDSTILLEIKQGKKLLEDCSGNYYQNQVDSFWTPNEEEYMKLNLNFYKLDSQIKELNNYIIQYIGIYLKGRKYIYINAFNKSSLKEAIRVEKDLKLLPVVICGGGSYFWRTLFDTGNNDFINTKINAAK